MPKQRTWISQKELASEFCKQAGGNGWGVSPCCFPEKIEEEFFPGIEDLFRAFTFVTPDRVEYVILGQDPYPNGKRGQPDNPIATGVAFGVRPEDIKNRQVHSSSAIYKILAGIYKKLSRRDRYAHSSLECWARSNKILLMNTALTVPKNGFPGAHLHQWERFTQAVLEQVSPEAKFIAWGKNALVAFEKTFPDRCKVKFDHPSTSGNFAEFWNTDIGIKLSACNWKSPAI